MILQTLCRFLFFEIKTSTFPCSSPLILHHVYITAALFRSLYGLEDAGMCYPTFQANIGFRLFHLGMKIDART